MAFSFPNLFSSAPAQQQAAPNQQPTNQQTAPNGAPPQAGTSTVPANPPAPNGQMPGTQQVPANPLDSYAKLWDDSTRKPEAAPTFTLDSKVLGEVAAAQDFSKSVPAELMAKATSGDAAAMTQAMNIMAQQAYLHAMQHGSTLTDKFVNAHTAHSMKGVDGQVRSVLTQQALADTPNYSHPVVRQEFTRIANQFQSANPDHSPQQVAEAAKTYMQEIYNATNPTSQAKSTEPVATDWEKFITG